MLMCFENEFWKENEFHSYFEFHEVDFRANPNQPCFDPHTCFKKFPTFKIADFKEK